MRTNAKIVNRLTIFLVFALVCIWIIAGCTLFALQYPKGEEYALRQGFILGLASFAIPTIGFIAMWVTYQRSKLYSLLVAIDTSEEG